jgi:hypothetical protein
MDVAEEERNEIPDPRTSAAWGAAVVDAIHSGEVWDVEPAFLNAIALHAFGCRTEFQKEPMAAVVALAWLLELLERRKGRCWGWVVGGGGQRPTWCC